MRLMLLKEAARTGVFESEAAIRAMISRGQLRKGVHWFQQRPGARIRVDLDACVELFTAPPEPTKVPPADRLPDRIPVIRGGLALATKKGATSGLHDR